MTDNRKCWWINPAEFDRGRGFVPCLVVEDEPGYQVMRGHGRFSEPWYWGHTLEQARETARLANDKDFGITEEEAAEIVASSITLQLVRGPRQMSSGRWRTTRPVIVCIVCGRQGSRASSYEDTEDGPRCVTKKLCEDRWQANERRLARQKRSKLQANYAHVLENAIARALAVLPLQHNTTGTRNILEAALAAAKVKNPMTSEEAAFIEWAGRRSRAERLASWVALGGTEEDFEG